MAETSAASAVNAAVGSETVAVPVEGSKPVVENVTEVVAEETPSKRDAWRERYRKRFSPEAEEVDPESDEYYDNLIKMADDYDRMEGNEQQMNDLLSQNPSFSGMIRDAKEGKSFFPSLVERFGVDNLRQALEDPAVAEELGNANDAYMQRVQQEAEDSALSQSNMEETANNLQMYAQEHNMTDEQVSEVVNKMIDFVKDGIAGKFPTELIDMVYKAQNYDEDVQNARDMGVVQGRNENIQATLERSQQPQLPPNIGQSGTMPTERKDTRRKGVMPLTGEEFYYGES